MTTIFTSHWWISLQLFRHSFMLQPLVTTLEALQPSAACPQLIRTELATVDHTVYHGGFATVLSQPLPYQSLFHVRWGIRHGIQLEESPCSGTSGIFPTERFTSRYIPVSEWNILAFNHEL